MPILLTCALLFGTAAILTVLRLVRPKFRFGWLMAVGATSAALLTVVLWEPQLPLTVMLPWWRSTGLFTASPALSAASLSWPYAFSLVGLALAALLTAPARPGIQNPMTWAISTAFVGLGVLAVTADDPLTLVLVWAALDLAELAIVLVWAEGRAPGGRAVTAFSVRFGAIALVIFVQVLGAAGGKAANFVSTPSRDGLLLLAAAALRLGVLPVPLLHGSGQSTRSAVGALLQISSAAASLVLFSRIPPASLISSWVPILVLLCAAAALYAGWMWLRAPEEIAGRPYWILGLTGLAAACALRGNPAGATGWGVALILTGGTLSLSSIQQAWLQRAVLIGGWTVSALPFSVTAGTWSINTAGLDWPLPAFLIAQVFLLAGFIRQATRPSARPAPESQPSWAGSAYATGIGFLLTLQVLLGLWGWEGARQIGAWLAGAIVVTLGLGLVWAIPRVPALSPVPANWLPPVSGRADNWLGQELHGVSRGLERLSQTVTDLLEGEAGIMWSLLLLVLFVSLVARGIP